MKASDRLAIASGITDAYVLPLLVMLTSLTDHLRSTAHPVLYLLHRGLRDESLEAISGVVETRPVTFGAADLAALPEHRHLPPEAACPLLLADLLPADQGRVLFLDADLLILDDATRLWSVDLDGRVVAAAPDSAIRFCSSPRGVKGYVDLGIPDHAVYFNAGVLLTDLDAWRQRDVTHRAFDYLRSTGESVDFLHQEALNAVLWDDWRPLPARWNLLAGVAGRPFQRPGSNAWRDAGIVHFAGRLKPWRMPVGGLFNERYQAVLERVLHLAPPRRRTWSESLYSLYDRRLRDFCYPLERFLWNRRIL